MGDRAIRGTTSNALAMGLIKPPKPMCAILLFRCDVKWVSAVERKPLFRASAFEGLSFQLEIVIRQRGNVTQVSYMLQAL